MANIDSELSVLDKCLTSADTPAHRPDSLLEVAEIVTIADQHINKLGAESLDTMVAPTAANDACPLDAVTEPELAVEAEQAPVIAAEPIQVQTSTEADRNGQTAPTAVTLAAVELPVDAGRLSGTDIGTEPRATATTVKATTEPRKGAVVYKNNIWNRASKTKVISKTKRPKKG